MYDAVTMESTEALSSNVGSRAKSSTSTLNHPQGCQESVVAGLDLNREPSPKFYKDHILFPVLRVDSPTSSGILTRNCALDCISTRTGYPKRVGILE